MNFFTVIPDAWGIIHSRGVYRQVPLYERAGRIHAKYGAGFVRLNQGGGTSCPNVRWAELDPGEGSYSEGGSFVTYIPPAGQIEGAATRAVAAQ